MLDIVLRSPRLRNYVNNMMTNNSNNKIRRVMIPNRIRGRRIISSSSSSSISSGTNYIRSHNTIRKSSSSSVTTIYNMCSNSGVDSCRIQGSCVGDNVTYITGSVSSY